MSAGAWEWVGKPGLMIVKVEPKPQTLSSRNLYVLGEAAEGTRRASVEASDPQDSVLGLKEG